MKTIYEHAGAIGRVLSHFLGERAIVQPVDLIEFSGGIGPLENQAVGHWRLVYKTAAPESSAEAAWAGSSMKKERPQGERPLLRTGLCSAHA
jgi:hypothetical protein